MTPTKEIEIKIGKRSDMIKLIPGFFNQDKSVNHISALPLAYNPPNPILCMQILPLIHREENIMRVIRSIFINSLSFLVVYMKA